MLTEFFFSEFAFCLRGDKPRARKNGRFCGRSRIKFGVHFHNARRYPSSPVMETIVSYDVVFGVETERAVLVY